jgi:hypothetical protein
MNWRGVMLMMSAAVLVYGCASFYSMNQPTLP